MADPLVFVGSFGKKADGIGAQAVTGVGFTPKAIIFWTEFQSANETWAANVTSGIGMTAGAANSYALNSWERDAQADTDARTSVRAFAITMVGALAGAATQYGAADLTSFDADGFTLNWTLNPASFGAVIIHFMAIGGAAVTNASVVNWTQRNAGAGDKAVTGVGFQPTAVLTAFSVLTGALPATGSAAAGHGIAAWSSPSSTVSAFSRWGNNAGSVEAARYQRSDKAMTFCTQAAADDKTATLTSFDADGFTLSYSSAASAGLNHCISLCLRGPVFKAGSFNKSTGAAPVSQAVTGLGLKPVGVMFMTVGATTNANPQTEARLAIGATDGTHGQAAAMHNKHAAAGNTEADGYSSQSKAVLVVNNDTPAVDASATITTLNNDGFTINWGVNDGNATEILYFALGSLFVPGGGSTSGKGRGSKKGGGKGAPPSAPPSAPSGSFRATWSTSRKDWF